MNENKKKRYKMKMKNKIKWIERKWGKKNKNELRYEREELKKNI